MNYDSNVILEYLIKNSLFSNELSDWTEVLNVIRQPIPDQLLEITKTCSHNIKLLNSYASKLSQLSAEDLKTLINMALHSKEASHYNFESLNKRAQKELAQKFWGGTKFLTKETLRLIPFIGFVFSFMLTLKNLIYSILTFAQLLPEAKELGISWIDCLYSSKLLKIIQLNQNDPEKLKMLVKITKYSKMFLDEGISLLANSSDLAKDLIFSFLATGTFGIAGIMDIGLSAVFMALEWSSESAILKDFDLILRKILSITNSKIEELTASSSNEDKSSIYQWFLN